MQQKQIYELIRRKAFYGVRFQKKWLVIVDGTQNYLGSRKLNDGCLERHYNKGTYEETVNYHCDVLEAKIVFGESLIVSIASEFIENYGEDAGSQKNRSEEKRKQNCETKAFSAERFPMSDKHSDNQKECGESSGGRQKTLEDRKRGI